MKKVIIIGVLVLIGAYFLLWPKTDKTRGFWNVKKRWDKDMTEDFFDKYGLQGRDLLYMQSTEVSKLLGMPESGYGSDTYKYRILFTKVHVCKEHVYKGYMLFVYLDDYRAVKNYLFVLPELLGLFEVVDGRMELKEKYE